jgi:hypothetical protein
LVIVVLSELHQLLPGIFQRRKPLHVQTLVPQSAIETLDECVLHGPLALARDAVDEAIATATDRIEQSRARGRPKYEALGLITRARGLHALARTRDGIADAKTAVSVADRTGDPALLLLALDALIGLDGSDELATRARAVTDCIYEGTPNEVMRRCFTESEVVRRIRAPQ